MSIRVRFAPSPTGFLHIGGARTALFNWLYARHCGGKFILRIEDTDTVRNTQEAVDVIINGLRWMGLDWDEGPASGDAKAPGKGDCGPYFQSQRTSIYTKRIQELRDKGMAYDSEGTVKFRMTREPIVIKDLVIGDVRRELTDREAVDPDFVIVRSDGQPVFHLVNVVDDIEMNITHVIRGEDHVANTAKHLALFKAFGVEPPRYAHIPLILNTDGTKMSKRDTGASMMSYVEEGFLPEALVNFLALLGWSPKDDRQVIATDELIRLFDLPQILRHNARFDMQKLLWMNGEYMRAANPKRFCQIGAEFIKKSGLPISNYDAAYVESALVTCQAKVKRFNELPAFADFYFMSEITLDPTVVQDLFKPENRPRIERLKAALSALETFSSENIEAVFKASAKELGVKVGLLVHPIRLACTGKSIGPSLYHLMAIIGRQTVLQRLDKACSLTST